MKKILVIGGGAVLVLLCACVIIFAVANNSAERKTDATPAVQAQAQISPEPANTTAPGNTPKPTNTVKPTETPKPPTATATPKTLPKIGIPAESAGVVVTVNKTSKSQGSNPYMKPKAGNTFLLVDVTVSSNRKDKTPYNSMYFKVKDASGFEYNSGISLEEPSFKSGELATGESVRGLLQFEVPADATGFVLSYKPLVLFSDYQEIKVLLE